MAGNTSKKIKTGPGISEENNSAVDRAIQKATREALKMHKLADNPVAVWQDGKVVILKPGEISF